MTSSHIVVKYHNEKMLMTLDLNQLVKTFFDHFGDRVLVEFVPMSPIEKKESSGVSKEIDGLIIVNDRFYVFESYGGGESARRSDIEEEIVRQGRK